VKVARLLAGLVLLGTVDRVEGRWLVVEWRAPEGGVVWTDLRRARVAGPVGEGDRVCASFARSTEPSEVERWLLDGGGRGGRVRIRAAGSGGGCSPFDGEGHERDR
jgi:hypothetical protein